MPDVSKADPVQSADTHGRTRPRLKDRIALGDRTSRGLGRFFAETLAREGATVVLAGRSNLQDVIDGIARTGGVAHAVEMDVTRDNSILRAFEEIDAEWGCPTVIVNNAGITDVVDTLEQAPADSIAS